MASQFDFLDLSGLIIADTEETRDGVASDFKQVFGQDLDVRDETPQGVLINLFTEQRNVVLRNNAAIANQINPNVSGGVFQDAIASLSGLNRSSGDSSVAECNLTGEPLLLIPSGSTAKTIAGDLFQLNADVTLNGTGTGSGIFFSVEKGPINAAPNTIIEIVSGVLGWETVTNPAAANPGTQIESDEAFRILRRITLALQGLTLPEAITSNINNIANVKSSIFRENRDTVTQTIDNVVMIPKSIFVCVDGDAAADNDIAQVLLDKTVGATWNGTTVVTKIEPISGQPYNVRFTRAEKVLVLVKITANSGSVPDPESAIKQSIVDYSNGNLPGDQGLIVGRDVSPSELARAISKVLYPDIFVESVEVSLSAPISFSKDNIFIEIFQKAEILESAIEVILV